MVIASGRCRSASLLQRCASEFGNPEDECVLQQSSLSQVVDESGDGAIDFTAFPRESGLE